MVNTEKNRTLNTQLEKLYERVQTEFLDEHEQAYGFRIPRLLRCGIIEEEAYDADQGILIVLKEANDWIDDGTAADGNDFLGFVRCLIEKGAEINVDRKPAERVRMVTWYNLARWIVALVNPEKSSNEIAQMYGEALAALGKAAITNVNKATGFARVDKRYYQIAKSEVAIKTLKEEIELLAPKTILFCGAAWVLGEDYRAKLREKGCAVLEMCHPGARIAKTTMLDDLRGQLAVCRAEHKGKVNRCTNI